MRNILIVSFLLLAGSGFSQTFEADQFHQDTIATCSGTFFDSGGQDNDYGDDEHYVVTFAPDGSQPIVFEFIRCRINQGDTLKVHDGPDTTSVLLHELTDIDSSFTLISGDTITFQFLSNASDRAAGWEASISCMDTDFYSNGNGGGNWSDPAAWYDGSVPSASDDAVVLLGDTLRLGGDVNIRDITVHTGGVVQFQDHTMNITGDLVVQGQLTGMPTFSFTGATDQNISVYSGNTLSGLIVDKASGTLFSGQSLQVDDTLKLPDGLLDMQGQVLTLGTGTATDQEGFLTTGSGAVIGTLQRWVNQTGQDYLFPLSAASNSRAAILRFTDLTPGLLQGEFIETDPGADGLPLYENDSLWIDHIFTEGYWVLEASNGLSADDYSLQLVGDGMTSHNIAPGTRVVKRENGSGPWALDGSHLEGVPDTVKRTGLSGFSHFALGDTLLCPPPEVHLSGLDSVYDIRDAVDTLHGTPAGGTYTGAGLTDSLFDPGAAGVGSHTLYYEYTNPDGCSNTDSASTEILDYDYRSGARELTTIDDWTSQDAEFSTEFATIDENTSSCNASGQQANVWFKFQATTNAATVTVETGAAKGSMQRQVVNIWNEKGDLVKCKGPNGGYNWQGTIISSIDTLTPGNWYYLSVEHDANSSGNPGSFTLGIDDEANYDYLSGAYELTDISHWESEDAEFSTINATPDGDTTDCNSTGVNQNVWFTFQATTSAITIDVKTGDGFGSLDRQVVGLFDDSGNPIACKGPLGGYNWDGTIQLSVDSLTTGERYYISVDHDAASSGSAGSFTLNVDNSPSYDHRSGAFELEDISNWCSDDVTFSTSHATPDSFKTSCNTGGPYANVWFSFQATTSSMTIDVKTGDVFGSMDRQEVSLWNASGELIKCNIAPESWNWDGTITLSEDSLTPGNRYYIAVDYDPSNAGNPGTFTLCVDDQPNNDKRSGAIELIDLNNWCSPPAAYSTSNATGGADTSSCDADGPNADVWFKFQATTHAATIKVKTGSGLGSMDRQKITLWDSTGNEIACVVAPESWNWDGTWMLSVDTLTVDSWYFISVDHDPSNSGNAGTFTLCIDDAPAFDYRSNARELPILDNWCSSDAAYSSVNATPDGSSTTCHPTGPLANVWFTFRATTNAISIDLKTGSGYGTMDRQEVALWDSSGNLIQCLLAPESWNWDGTLNITTDTLTPGERYYISVDHDNSNAGNWGTFSLCIDDAPAYDKRTGAVELTDMSDWCSAPAVYDNSDATADTLSTCAGGTNANVWFTFQASTPAVTIDLKTGSGYGSMDRQVVSLWDSTGNLISCKAAPNSWNWDGTITLSSDTLTVDERYFISVDYDNGNSGNPGTFTLCLDDEPNFDFKSGAYELTDIDNWQSSDAAFSNVNATPGADTSSCLPEGPNADVWFKFQATTNASTIKVLTGGSGNRYGSMDRQVMTLWDSNGDQVICSASPNSWNWDGTVSMTVDTLNIGEWYYISVDHGNGNSANAGSFTLYVDDGPEFDFQSGAIELTDLDDWCSGDGAYDNTYASPDKASSGCYPTGPHANVWFTFTAISDTVEIEVVTGGGAGSMDRQQIALWNSSQNEIHCVSAPNSWNWDGTLSLTLDTLTPGNQYWISVDNFTGNAGNTGTFRLCINNTKDTYYSRNDGAWDNASTWSKISHTGPAASTSPGLGDIVYIRGHQVNITDPNTAAAVYITVADGTTGLMVDGGSLEVDGRLTMTNNGASHPGNITLQNDATVTVKDNMSVNRDGGDQSFEITLSDASELDVNGNLSVSSTAGTSEPSRIQLNNESVLDVGDDMDLTSTGGTKMWLELNDQAQGMAGRDITLNASSANAIEIAANNTSSITLSREIIRPAPGYGIISFSDNSTLYLNGDSYLQKLPSSRGSGGDSIRYQNVTLQNTKVTSPQVTVVDTVKVHGDLNLQDGVIGTTPDNLLVLSATATVSGGSEQSYVEGPLKKIGNTSFTFPLGKSSNYQPLSIAAPDNIADAYTAEYFNQDPGESYDPDSRVDGLHNISGSEYWRLDKETGTTGVQPTIGWNSNSDCVYNLDSIRMAAWNGSQWQNYGRHATTGTTGEGTITADSVIVYSSTVLTYANSLPHVRIDGLMDAYCEVDNDYALSGFPQDGNGTFTGYGITDNGDGTALFNPDGGGGETQTITYTYDSGGCTNELSEEVVIHNLPTSTILGGDTICEGSSTELDVYFTGQGPWSFSYTNGTDSITQTTSDNPYSFEATRAGGYYVYELNDDNGCSAAELGDTAFVELYQVERPTITPDEDQTICEGQKVTLTASEAHEYYWSTGETTRSIDVTEAEDYFVYTITENNCVSEHSEAVSVEVNPLPFKPGIPKGDNNYCSGELSSDFTTSGALYANANEYQWKLNPESAGTVMGTSTSTTIQWDEDFEGSAWLKVRGHNDCGYGSYSDSILISINSAPTVDLGPDVTACPGYTLDAGNPGADYLWNTGATTQTLSLDHSGTYHVRVTSVNGCVGYDTVSVVISQPEPQITASPDSTICFDTDTISLRVDENYNDYNWSPGDSLMGEDSTIYNPLYYPRSNPMAVSNTFTISVEVTDSVGCQATDEMEIEVFRKPETGNTYHIPNDFDQE